MTINWNNVATWARDIFGYGTIVAGAMLQANVLPAGSKPYLIASAVVAAAAAFGKQVTNPQTYPQTPIVQDAPK